MEKENRPTGVLAYKRTFGNIEAKVWANLQKSGKYSFRMSLKRILESRNGRFEYTNSFRPEDLDNIMFAATMVRRWLKNPVLMKDMVEEKQMVIHVPPAPPETSPSPEVTQLKNLRDFFRKSA